MKLVRHSINSGTKIGAVKGAGILDRSGRIASIGDNMIELIARWSGRARDASSAVA
jgi:hypothetical protein